MSVQEVVGKMVESVRGSVALMIGRAVLSAINDGGAIQTAQARLLADETQDDVERIQEYGFTSHPPAGSEAVVVFIGGARDHGLIVATDNRKYRIKALKSGEVCIYTDEGDSITLKRDNLIEVKTKTLHIEAETVVEIIAPDVLVSGNLMDSTDAKNAVSLSRMREIYNTHTHPENNTGSTNSPNQKM